MNEVGGTMQGRCGRRYMIGGWRGEEEEEEGAGGGWGGAAQKFGAMDIIFH